MKFAAIFALCSAVALATTNNCPNGTATSTVNNGATSNSVPIPGAGPGNDFSTLGVGGCTAIDLNFTNFSGTFSGSGTGNSPLTLNGTYFAETPAGIGANPLITPDSITLASVRGTAAVNTDADNNDGSNNWVSNSNSVIHGV